MSNRTTARTLSCTTPPERKSIPLCGFKGEAGPISDSGQTQSRTSPLLISSQGHRMKPACECSIVARCFRAPDRKRLPRATPAPARGEMLAKTTRYLSACLWVTGRAAAIKKRVASFQKLTCL
jgi:hypothetical protein